MSKYAFEKLGPKKFETMVQALLEKQFRLEGTLCQFGDGQDGGREATWTQPIEHEKYRQPISSEKRIPKEWVFQVKYHDIGLRGWSGARAEIESELEDELQKIVKKYEVPCHKYIMITNVPFSGVRHVGTRDKVNLVIKKWQKKIPEIEVWDAVDLSRMLDSDPGTRTTYLDEILPGDVLKALMKNLDFRSDRCNSAFYAYLKSILRSERDAKAEEAGDESGLQLEKIFVDLDLKLNREKLVPSVKSALQDFINRSDDEEDYHVPTNPEKVPASLVFLRADYKFMLLKGGPGVGKSTITQFLTLYHAARIVDRSNLAVSLAKQLKLTGGVSATELDSYCKVRFPLRVELRRYAKWISDDSRETQENFLALYLAERVNKVSSSQLCIDDIFALANDNPILLILDGLDEVPQPHLRDTIFFELNSFLDRCEGESCDLQVILSTRPQGYRSEFDGYEPVEWQVIDLDRNDFFNYSTQWLQERIAHQDEREDALQRIKDGMKYISVQQMATTLLQATVMLTIARRKFRIPHARHKLYERYVEVIFERERIKHTVREWDKELEHLHELAGYKIMCKMASEQGGQSLGGLEFRQCVHTVIEDYGPDDLRENTIGQVVEAIVTLAKDRLCLLAGKGDDQQDVDFVIHPFREYFAAAYLKNHEEAEPDRVYMSLVERHNIWANVLQFYSAFQHVSQQKTWILEADGSDVNQGTYQGIVRMTRIRRALVRLLPEFERPRNDHISRTFKNLFDQSTRWTWLEQDDVSHMIEAFAPDQSYFALKKLFENLSTDNLKDLFVELDLLAKTAGPKYKSEIRERLNQLSRLESLHELVIEVALRNDVAVDEIGDIVSKLEKYFQYPLRMHNPKLNNFFSVFSIGQIAEVLFSNLPIPIVVEHLESSAEKRIRELYMYFFSINRININGIDFVLPFTNRDGDLDEILQIINILEDEGFKLAPYLRAIVIAKKNPDDKNLLKEAHEQERLMGDDISEALSLNRQLLEFEAQFEDELSEKWLSRISLDDCSWITLFIHPEAWECLEPIVDDTRFVGILREALPLAKVFCERSNTQIRIRHWGGRHILDELDIFELCVCVLNVYGNYGNEFVLDVDSIVDMITSRIKPPDLNESQAKEILELALMIEGLPKYWIAFILCVSSTAEVSDLDLLLKLWENFGSQEKIWYVNDFSPSQNLIDQLVENDTEESISLAAFLNLRMRMRMRNQRIKRCRLQTEKRISERLCEYVESTSGEKQVTFLGYLLMMPPTTDELILLSNPEKFQLIKDQFLLVNHLVENINDVVNYCDDLSAPEVNDALGRFLDHRDIFPKEISLAALDALLQIGELLAKPLNEKDWQSVN